MTTRSNTAQVLQPRNAGFTEAEENISSPIPKILEHSDPAKFQSGIRIDRFVLLDCIGEGGMGVVYSAYDRGLGRKVALKFIRNAEGLRMDDTGAETRSRTRLLQEAQFMAQLSHPNVVTIFDVGEFNSHIYIAMEMIDGQTLGRRIEHGNIRIRQAIEIMYQAGLGLVAAHDAGLVHRDFKPDNILLGINGQICVSDFGLVYLNPEVSSDASLHFNSNNDDTNTSKSLKATQKNIVGTPAYMSPEQHYGETATQLSDQFSFCVCLYEITYGTRPFAGKTRIEISHAIATGNFQVPSRRLPVPRWLSRIIRKGLQVNPADRFPSMHTLLAEIEIHRNSRFFNYGLIASSSIVLASTIAYNQLGQLSGKDEFTNCLAQSRTIEDIWNEGQRKNIQNQFDASDLDFARPAWDFLDHWLDKRSSDWIQSYEDTCDQFHRSENFSNVEIDLKFDCLNEQREQFQTFVSLLVQADATTIEKSVKTAKSFPPHDLCQDSEQLKEVIRLPPEPSLRANVQDLRIELNRANLYRSIGKHEQAYEVIQKTVQRAHEINYIPLLAESYYALAWQNLALFDNFGAQKWLQRALDYAESSQDDDLTLKIANLGVYIHGCRLEDSSQTDTWIAHAQAHLLRAGEAPLQRAGWLTVVGAAYGDMGRLDNSIHALRQSFDIYQRELGPDHPNTLRVYRNLALTLRRLDQFAEAERITRKIIRTTEALQGATHPALVPSLIQLTNALCRKGDIETAFKTIRRAVNIQESINGKNSIYGGHAYHLRAIIWFDTGDYRQAAAQWQRMIRILQESNALPDVQRDTYAWLAQTWTRLGRYDMANRSMLKVDLENWGPKNGRHWEHAYLAAIELELAQKRIDRASTIFTALLQQKHEESQIDLLDPTSDKDGKFNLIAGNLARAQNQPNKALQHHQMALQLAQSQYFGAINPLLFPYLSELATSIAMATKDYKKAAEVLSQALHHLGNLPTKPQPVSTLAYLRLGEYLTQDGEWTRAHRVLLRADGLQPMEEVAPKYQTRIKKLRQKIESHL